MIILLEQQQLSIKANSNPEQLLSDKELGIVQWVLDLGKMAGLGTDTLTFSDALFIPFLGAQGPIGVVRLHPKEAGYLFSDEQLRLLDVCANQIAVAIEADHIAEQSRQSELQSESDRLQSALLQSLSRDLRTPLISIISMAATQVESANNLDFNAIEKLGNDISTEAEQMNRLLHNLLQITYFESEQIKLKKTAVSLKKLIDSVMTALDKKLSKKKVFLHIPNDLPKVWIDQPLIKEVFLNLIDNVVKYTPPESPIDISVAHPDHEIIISVEDRGPGIMPDEVNRLFEKFYRGRKLSTERGLGLGLAICQKIIQAHGGTIWAENRLDGGSAFRFTLPI